MSLFYNISNEELAIKLFKIVSNSDLFDVNLENIPTKMDDKNFRKEMLKILFKNYVVLQYPTIIEQDIDGELEKNEYGIENNGICDKKLKVNTAMVDSITAEKIKKDVEQLQEQYKTYALVLRNGTRIPLISRLVVSNNTKKYEQALADDHSFWRFSVGSKVSQAINDAREKQDAEARDAFKRGCCPNAKKFADGILIYTEIFRDIYDVHKIIDRFLSINKWIKGEEVKSKITCMFNTDTRYGQNGKTERMRLERKYMSENGFRTAERKLCFNHCKDEKEFTEHLFYKDEFDFTNTNPDDMKIIHNNIAPTIERRVLYKGDVPYTNEAFFYLCTHNGKTSEAMTNNDRLADWIRISDAKYEDNKDKLTTIYEDKPFEDKTLFNQICYKDLFDVLLKCATEYDKAKVSKRPTAGISVHAGIIEILDNASAAQMQSISLSRIFSKLNKSRYFPKEKAKQEVKALHDYLLENYPELIIGKEKKNWIERSIRLSQDNGASTLNLIELANAESTTEINTNLLDRETLKKYIYGLFGLDVNLTFENPCAYYTLEELQPIYDKWCDTFIPVTKTKIDKAYTDKESGKRLELIYEGVNIPHAGVTNGHKSRFTNDNMMITPRFLVEYDAPEGSSDEDIEKSKQAMLKMLKQWPTFRVVDSGNKSIHMLFCFDLESLPNTIDEFRFAVRYAIQQLNIPDNIGCAELDYKALVDPSRITRQPGVSRENGNEQTLISFNKHRVHIDWHKSYEAQKANMEREKKEALKLKILTEYEFGEYGDKKTDNVGGFIDAYMLKHGLVWVKGQRHSVAAKIAGACNLAGFSEQECIEALKDKFDCSDDPSILSNLRKFFDE